MYKSENLSFIPSQVVDNQDVLDLIESKPHGLLPLLDEECRLGKGSVSGYFTKIANFQRNNRRFTTSVHMKKTEFMVHHYAGEVKYDITGWLEKNKDELSSHLQKMMEASKVELVSKMFVDSRLASEQKAATALPGSSQKHKLRSESAEFIAQLEELTEVRKCKGA